MSLLPLLVPPECLFVAVNAVVLLLLPREEEDVILNAVLLCPLTACAVC